MGFGVKIGSARNVKVAYSAEDYFRRGTRLSQSTLRSSARATIQCSDIAALTVLLLV